ncbi:MAG: hypothetical protein HY673_10880 [Chloroflexi bacterium]|nr:hypothetical protein [Chloroflexota bacterium]
MVTIAARSHNSRTAPHIFKWPLSTDRYKGGKEAFLSDMMEAHLSVRNELGDLAGELKRWLDGVDNKAGTVGDSMWAIAGARWCATVARMVGQPDMFMGTAPVENRRPTWTASWQQRSPGR